MKITSVNIPLNLTKNSGLKEIKMNNLKDVVILAGKNGSGKTRILNLIFERLKRKPTSTNIQKTKSLLASLQDRLPNQELSIEEIKLELEYLENNLKESKTINERKLYEETHKKLSNEMEMIKSTFSKQIMDKERHEEILKWNDIITDKSYEFHPFAFFMPKSVNLIDPDSLVKKDLISRYINLSNQVGVPNIEEYTLPTLQHIQDKWYLATHPKSTVDKVIELEITETYNILQELILQFLDTSLGRNSDGQATLFGKPIFEARLSEGQKILIQICVILAAQNKNLTGLVLVLEEPENYLHPSALIRVLDKIKENISDGQLWIATHSISVLAHYETDRIWYVEDGSVKKAYKIPEQVLQSLIGDETENQKLEEFLNAPIQFASTRFAIEALSEPMVVGARSSEDPQLKQIRKYLKNEISRGSVNVLDWGAGKGRLISSVLEDHEYKQLFQKSIDYVAFDPSDFYKDDCCFAIEQLYDSYENRYFNNVNTLYARYDREYFNIIILCNVLHEIDPKEWLSLFRKGGKFDNLLSNNGYLLIIEDQTIPKGEKAFRNGFLVLNTKEYKCLFNIKRNDDCFGYEESADKRLTAHFIGKKHMLKISTVSRAETIESIATKSKNEIINLRTSPNSFSNGLRHGFWVQQLANSTLCMEEFPRDCDDKILKK